MRKLWLISFMTLALTAMVVQADTTQELAASSGETLEFDLNTGGDIKVIGWDRESASVTTEVTGRDAAKVQVKVERTSNGIEISTPSFRHERVRVSVKVRVQVPTRFNVKVNTTGGDVELGNLDGSFTGATMGGDMDLHDLTGDADLSTMGGDIDVRDSALDGEVSTMGGDVTFDTLSGSLDGSTMGGDITQRNVTRGGADGKAVTISSHGGDVEVDVAMSGASVKTMGGDIHVNRVADHLEAETMGGDIIIREAEGETNISTMGGDIEVGSFDGSIKAVTMGGDVDVNVVGINVGSDHDIDLRSMGGDLLVELPAGFSGRFQIELVKLRKHENKARIESDFPLDINEPAEWTPKGERTNGNRYGDAYKIITATGTVGSGDHLVKLETVGGLISIKDN